MRLVDLVVRLVDRVRAAASLRETACPERDERRERRARSSCSRAAAARVRAGRQPHRGRTRPCRRCARPRCRRTACASATPGAHEREQCPSSGCTRFGQEEPEQRVVVERAGQCADHRGPFVAVASVSTVNFVHRPRRQPIAATRATSLSASCVIDDRLRDTSSPGARRTADRARRRRRRRRAARAIHRRTYTPSGSCLRPCTVGFSTRWGLASVPVPATHCQFNWLFATSPSTSRSMKCAGAGRASRSGDHV